MWTPPVIAALSAGITAVIGAVFNGIALLRHASNPQAHASQPPQEPQ
jgi:hypothetical protein